MKKRLLSCFLTIVIVVSLLSIPEHAMASDIVNDKAVKLEWSFDELYDNGCLLAQNEEYVFYNSEDDDCLCAQNKVDGSIIKLADFPAANINIYDDSLYFTDMTHNLIKQTSIGIGAMELKYGGTLYKIDRLSSISSGPSIRTIGMDGCNYYNLKYDNKGFYALILYEDNTTEYVKMDEEGGILGYLRLAPGETIVNVVEMDGFVYLEVLVDVNEGEQCRNYILCIDRDGGSNSRTVVYGMNLHLIGGRIVFQSTSDFYLYSIYAGENEAKVISYYAVENFFTFADTLFCHCKTPAGIACDSIISWNYWTTPYAYTAFKCVNGWKNMIQCGFIEEEDSSIKESKYNNTLPIQGQGSSYLLRSPLLKVEVSDVTIEDPETGIRYKYDDIYRKEYERDIANLTPCERAMKWTDLSDRWGDSLGLHLRRKYYEVSECPIKPDLGKRKADESQNNTVSDDGTKADLDSKNQKSDSSKAVENKINPEDSVLECMDIWNYLKAAGRTDTLSYNSSNGGVDKFKDWYGAGDPKCLMDTEKASLKSELGGYGLSDEQMQKIADLLPQMVEDFLGQLNPTVKFVEASSDNKKAVVEVTTNVRLRTKVDQNELMGLLTGDWRQMAGVSASDSRADILYKTFMFVIAQYKWYVNENRTDRFVVYWDDATQHWRMSSKESNKMVDMVIDEQYTSHNANINTPIEGSKPYDLGGLFGNASGKANGSSNGNSNTDGSGLEYTPPGYNSHEEENKENGWIKGDPDPNEHDNLDTQIFKTILDVAKKDLNKKYGDEPYFDPHEEACDILLKYYDPVEIMNGLKRDKGLEGFITMLGEKGTQSLIKDLKEGLDAYKAEDIGWGLGDEEREAVEYLIRMLENRTAKGFWGNVKKGFDYVADNTFRNIDKKKQERLYNKAIGILGDWCYEGTLKEGAEKASEKKYAYNKYGSYYQGESRNAW